MPVIKVTGMTSGRLRLPDLDAQEEFFTHFGMVRTARTKHALYMRGTDPAHHIPVTAQGEPGFVGLDYMRNVPQREPPARNPASPAPWGSAHRCGCNGSGHGAGSSPAPACLLRALACRC